MPRQPKPWRRADRKVWCVTINGVRHNLGPDKRQAYERFYELMRQPSSKKLSSQSLVAVIDAFLDWVQHHRAADTYEWYRYRLERFARRYRDLSTAALRPFHVQEWVDSCVELSPTSKRNYIRSIKRCLRWAQRLGYVDKNPIAHMELPAQRRRNQLITAAEFGEMRKLIRDPSFDDLVVVTWETGCRPQESLRVEARHVDLENNRWVIPSQEAKNQGLTRVIYLSDVALAITRRLVNDYPQGRLFRNCDGIPWTTEAVNCAFRRLRERMGRAEMEWQGIEIPVVDISRFARSLRPTRTVKGRTVAKSEREIWLEAKRKLTQRRAISLVPPRSLYALRHSWATRALENGLDALTVAILMGHKDPSTLARVYQHLSMNPKHLLAEAKRAAS